MAWQPFADFYLFRWNPWSFLILLIVLGLWIWWKDTEMRNEDGEGLIDKIKNSFEW